MKYESGHSNSISNSLQKCKPIYQPYRQKDVQRQS